MFGTELTQEQAKSMIKRLQKIKGFLLPVQWTLFMVVFFFYIVSPMNFPDLELKELFIKIGIGVLFLYGLLNGWIAMCLTMILKNVDKLKE